MSQERIPTSAESARSLAEAMHAVAGHILAMLRDGEKPERIHERASLMEALAKELRSVMDGAIDAQGPDVLAAHLIERARQM